MREVLVRRHPGDGGIAGYSYPEQLEWLRSHARTRLRILEVGAWLGRCTDALAEATRGTVTVVDSWEGSSDPDDEVNGFQGEPAFQEYLANISPHRNVITYRMPSAEAWRRLHHAQFDMVWIDADHTYQHVKDDILMWRALLAPRGLICGHDGEYPDVALAVKELLPRARSFQTKESIIWWDCDAV